MTMTPTEAYENIVIRAVLTNDNNMWAEAHLLACSCRFTTEIIEVCHANVERWLRLHGVTKMDDSEKAALVLVQSVVRRWMVQRVLKHQYVVYSRLATLDSLDHSKRAESLRRTLACAWKQIHCR